MLEVVAYNVEEVLCDATRVKIILRSFKRAWRLDDCSNHRNTLCATAVTHGSTAAGAVGISVIFANNIDSSRSLIAIAHHQRS